MVARGQRWVALLLVLLGCAGVLQRPPVHELSVSGLQGAWYSTGAREERAINFDGDRLLALEGGKLVIRGIVRLIPPDLLILRHEGVLETWHITKRNGILWLGSESDLSAYRKSKNIPAELELRPYKIAPSHPISGGVIETIQGEIAERNRKEQEIRKDKSPGARQRQAAIGKANERYLISLAAGVGWLDVARFGRKTSVLATIILKHTENLPFELAALPYVEKDLKATGDGQTYAVLYDDVQLLIGRKQRYGTQIGRDSKGEPYVLPLEDPIRVDEYLKEIGLPPLSSYLADISKALFDNKPVRLATPEESGR